MNGIFKEFVDKLLVRESRLKASKLDGLHRNDVEIVSPHFMNQRQIKDKVLVPSQERSFAHSPNPPVVTAPDALLFDKTDKRGLLRREKR